MLLDFEEYEVGSSFPVCVLSVHHLGVRLGKSILAARWKLPRIHSMQFKFSCLDGRTNRYISEECACSQAVLNRLPLNQHLSPNMLGRQLTQHHICEARRV